MITIKTPRLLIRDHVLQDLPTHHSLFSDSRVMYYLQDIQTHSIEQSRQNLRLSIAEIDNPLREYYFLRIMLADRLDHVGEIGYTVTGRGPQGKRVHLGYFTRPQYWGNGYVTEAVTAILRFAFLQDGVDCVTTGCIQENVGSERVMQKCGLIRCEDYNGSERHDGRMKKRVEYRLFRREWLQARGAHCDTNFG